MNGEIDFADALRERVALLRGLPLDALERTWAGVRLTPGARDAGRDHARARRAWRCWSRAASPSSPAASPPWSASTRTTPTSCWTTATALTGEVGEPILDRDAKLATLLELAAAGNLPLAATLAVGDGANDLGMIRAAGLGSRSAPSRSWPRRRLPAGPCRSAGAAVRAGFRADCFVGP